MCSKGRLIVLEGLDGSGKSTQFERVYNILSANGQAIKKISFPDYNEPSSALVRMYLNGDFSSDPADVNAYAASTFYAADRYASYMRFWRNDYLSGSTILAARYTTSNCIYQMTKLKKAQWDNYLDWLEDFEYEKLGLPRPDSVVFLDMPIEISQKLMSKRYDGDDNKKDIHEANVEFLRQCRESALYAAQRKGWIVLPCSENGEPLAIDEITNRLLNLPNVFKGK
ncbi:MAG: deoxynucleoside kinase [Ruminococcus sp.]|nr:deoxynucleoside kinase [Ruminococcus sp.]